MSKALKADLLNLKSKLESIESDIGEKGKELKPKEDKFKNMDEQVKEILDNNNQIIRFNVGGTKFATYSKTLLNVPDTLFYKIILSKRLDLNNEIFFDRSPTMFGYILDFLRYNTINYKRFNKEQQEELKAEADYYEIGEIVETIEEKLKCLEMVALTHSGLYMYSGSAVASNKLEDVMTRDLNTGCCSTSPGWITIELNNEWEVDEVEVGGFTGNSSAWYSGNGNGSTIQTSKDNVNWTTVGTVPNDYANNIVSVKVTKTTCKYVKFSNGSYIGFGFINIKKVES